MSGETAPQSPPDPPIALFGSSVSCWSHCYTPDPFGLQLLTPKQRRYQLWMRAPTLYHSSHLTHHKPGSLWACKPLLICVSVQPSNCASPVEEIVPIQLLRHETCPRSVGSPTSTSALAPTATGTLHHQPLVRPPPKTSLFL